jgi:hypothetical protein
MPKTIFVLFMMGFGTSAMAIDMFAQRAASGMFAMPGAIRLGAAIELLSGAPAPLNPPLMYAGIRG